MFLLNTQRARKTEPLVNLFFEKLNSPSFKTSVDNELIPITNDCIKCFLEGDTKKLYNNFSKLSEYQFMNLKPMIPNLYQDLWLKGIEGDTFKLKLCGAGGEYK